MLILIYKFCFSNKETFKDESNHHKKHHNHKKNDKNIKDVCRGNLTDLEYLDHMIPHHQVAIDISIKLQKHIESDNPETLISIFVYFAVKGINTFWILFVL